MLELFQCVCIKGIIMFANVIEWCSIENGITDAVSDLLQSIIYLLLVVFNFCLVLFLLFQFFFFFLTRTEKRKSVIKYFGSEQNS